MTGRLLITMLGQHAWTQAAPGNRCIQPWGNNHLCYTWYSQSSSGYVCRMSPQGSEPGKNLFHVIHRLTHIPRDILVLCLTIAFLSPLLFPITFMCTSLYFLLIFFFHYCFLLLAFWYSHSDTSTNWIYYSMPQGILKCSDRDSWGRISYLQYTFAS